MIRRPGAIGLAALALALTAACGQTAPEQSAAGRAPSTAPAASGDEGASQDRGTGGQRHSAGRRDRRHSHAHRASTPSAGSAAGPRLSSGAYDDTTGTTARRPTSQRKVLAALPGSTSARCVAVGDRRDVRSGKLAMGDFAGARAEFHRTKGAYDAAPSFFYVIPEARDVHRVTVTITPLAGRGVPIRVSTRQVERAAQWKYFPISVKIPSPGPWRFAVRVGSLHGCFDTSFIA